MVAPPRPFTTEPEIRFLFTGRRILFSFTWQVQRCRQRLRPSESCRIKRAMRH